MEHRLRTGAVCLGVLGVSLLIAACDVKVGEQGVSLDVVRGKATDEWTRSYTLPKDGRLEIASGGGPVYVTAASGGDVQIRIAREARAGSDEAAKRALAEETIAEEVTPERVRVETTRSRRDNSAPFGSRRISTEYHVSIPAGLNVTIKAENADISLTGVEGRFTLENTNGGFRGRGVSGAVQARTVNGIIDVELVQVTGDVTATTVNGPVRLGLPPGVNATLEATTVNGVVVVDDALPFTATQRDRRRVSGTFGKGGPAISLQTTNGPVRIGPPGGRGRRGEPEVVVRELQGR